MIGRRPGTRPEVEMTAEGPGTESADRFALAVLAALVLRLTSSVSPGSALRGPPEVPAEEGPEVDGPSPEDEEGVP